eukprot:CAMPEP_0196580170 /NCGR_PEP_ID=MMETSP1081-20130531/27560_1 /TAXON_ID=36882 /ORGANISM="Pyramimonas amylifera, Strain CCMP720" /LENGTH=173 /DNA_ID=CAMNT_0041899971 /DNA_START=249 /DNA_END=770 /DNA_ORIENTATION=-
MPESSGFEFLNPDFEPSSEQIFAVVEEAFKEEREPPEGVVFAGGGEPLLKLDVLCESARLIKAKRHGVPLRVTTNGLVAATDSARVAQTLKLAGVKQASVALTTASPKQYMDLMQPLDGLGHAEVCGFIAMLAEEGVQVTCTAVDRPGVDIAAARALSSALGAVNFQIRTFHP